MVSKAADKSIKTSNVTFSSSMLWRMSAWTFRRADSVEWPSLYAEVLSGRGQLDCIYMVIILVNSSPFNMLGDKRQIADRSIVRKVRPTEMVLLSKFAEFHGEIHGNLFKTFFLTNNGKFLWMYILSRAKGAGLQ